MYVLLLLVMTYIFLVYGNYNPDIIESNYVY